MLSYILFNTLIYGSLARCVATLYRYEKYLNVSVGSMMIVGAYTIIYTVNQPSSRPMQLLILCGGFTIFLVTNYFIVAAFPHEQQRDLFGLIFTLGLSILLENVLQMLYGPITITGNMWTTIPVWLLVVSIIAIMLCAVYIFHISFWGKIREAIGENSASIRATGLPIKRLLGILITGMFPFLLFIGVLIANNSALKASDNLFYLIKAIGIMIMVGVEKKQYMYLGAFIYVTCEYLFFITRGLSISYKETLILFIILLVLLVKPQGLFHFRSRTL